MTHVQERFIENLRFLRKKKGISQLKLSELINISPNYLNAVENGKNFPSPEIIQKISDTLEVLPYQLFLEHQAETDDRHGSVIIPGLLKLKQRFDNEIIALAEKYQNQ